MKKRSIRGTNSAASAFGALFILLLCVGSANSAPPSDDKEAKESIESVEDQPSQEELDQERLEQVEREKTLRLTSENLVELEALIRKQTSELKRLNRELKSNGASPELENEILTQSARLDDLKNNFEQLAIGGVSLNIFGDEEQPKDWQEELTLVLKPLLENLRSLTEKPRKIENIRQAIEEQSVLEIQADNALGNLERLEQQDHSKQVKKELERVREKWQQLRAEASRKKELAELELQNLVNAKSSWYESFSNGVKRFARQRGLTLLIVLGVVITIIVVFRVLGKFVETRGKKDPKRSNRTTYRVLAYAQRLVMFVLIIIAVMVVLFVRGDVLLLALMSVLLFALILGLKNVLPQFIEESRILLNIGPVREQERVLVKGVPWRVATINFYSKLINPEIKGSLRLPLSEIKRLTSQPIGEHRWFPSSIGDWVLDSDKRLYQVTHQGPITVELQSAQLTTKLIPTEAYFASGVVNVSKSKRIRLVGVFGIDYSHQKIALDPVPQIFQKAVDEYLHAADIGTNDIEVKVEFQEAGASSLDYRVIVFIGVAAAKHYYRIGRYIQQACVKTCNEHNWTIPFPQLTVHRGIEIDVES